MRHVDVTFIIYIKVVEKSISVSVKAIICFLFFYSVIA